MLTLNPSDTKSVQVNDSTSGMTFWIRRTSQANPLSNTRITFVPEVSASWAVGVSAFTSREIVSNGPPPMFRFRARSLRWSEAYPSR